MPPGRMLTWIQDLRRVFDASESYRPERHYMRGPGPKSQARRSTETGPAPTPEPGARGTVEDVECQPSNSPRRA
jgi:hypothetical protein